MTPVRLPICLALALAKACSVVNSSSSSSDSEEEASSVLSDRDAVGLELAAAVRD